MVENGIKIPVPSGYFWSPYGKCWKPWKTSGSPKSTAVSLLTKIWLLTHWPIEIGRKSKTAQLWKESLYAPLWPECLYAYPVGKKFNACQVNWQIRSLHTLKSVVVNPKTDCQFEKNGFLTELKYICCKLGPFCVKFHLGQSRTNPLL